MILGITPINNNYYNRNISFKAKSTVPSSVSETPGKSPYEDLYKSMRDIELTIVEEEVIPPAKETPDEQISTKVDYTELETLPSGFLGYTELHQLIQCKNEKEAKEFIKKHPNFNINQHTKSDLSYIWLAISHNCDEVFVSELAANKALDLSITDKFGYNDLHYLCCYGYTKAVQTVVDNHPKLNLNQLTKDGASYIDLAKMNGHTDIVRILNKLIPTQTKTQKLETLPSDSEGYTELHWLISYRKEKEAREFIKRHPNFDVNQRTNNGLSYIVLAVNNKWDEDFVSELAANKALDLSKTDRHRWNDLHDLCWSGYTKAVQAVVDNHPNLNLNQLTAGCSSYIDLANKNGHTDIVKILEKLHR